MGKYFSLAPDQLVNPFHLSTADCSLQVGHFVLETNHVRPKLFGLPNSTTVVAQGQHAFIQFGIVGDEHAAFAGGECLGAVEGERSEFAHGTSAFAMVNRADGFGGILDDRNAVLFANSQQAIHVAQVAIQMHGDDGFGTRGNCRFGLVWVDAPGIFENIDKDRFGTQVDDGRGGGDPVGVGHYDFVTGADTQRGHAHVQGTSATGGGDGILHAQVLSEGGFEAVDVVIAMITPAVGCGVGGVAHFQLVDRGFGVENAGFHSHI